MFDELLSAALSLNPKFFHESSVALWICGWEMHGVQMRERAMLQGEFGDEDCSNRDLNPFNGIHDGESKLTVEHIALPDGLKGCAWDKRAVGLLEWMPVGTEAVIADRLKLAHQPIVIRDHQAAGNQKLSLLLIRQRRFRELQKLSGK